MGGENVKNNNRKIMQVLQLIKILNKSKNHNKEHSRCCTVFFSCSSSGAQNASVINQQNQLLAPNSLSLFVFCLFKSFISFLRCLVSCLFVLYAYFLSLSFCLTADIRHLRRFVRDDHFFFLLQTKQKNCVVIFRFFSSSLSLRYYFSLRSHLYLPKKQKQQQL